MTSYDSDLRRVFFGEIWIDLDHFGPIGWKSPIAGWKDYF